jgi:hypothetical protein
VTDPFDIAADLLIGKRPPRPGERPRVEVPRDDRRLLAVLAIMRDIGVAPAMIPPAKLPALLEVVAEVHPPGEFG